MTIAVGQSLPDAMVHIKRDGKVVENKPGRMGTG